MKITLQQAYRAMYYFLDNEYQLTGSDELGGLLGSLSWEIWKEGTPGDPGAWQDWTVAVQKAVAETDDFPNCKDF